MGGAGGSWLLNLFKERNAAKNTELQLLFTSYHQIIDDLRADIKGLSTDIQAAMVQRMEMKEMAATQLEEIRDLKAQLAKLTTLTTPVLPKAK